MISRTAVSIAVAAAALAVWAHAAEHNVGLPVYGGPVLGSVFAACGAMLLLAGLAGILVRWIPQPVFAGFVIVCLGVSMITGSPAGLWLVTPVAALACAAFVLGYQRHQPEHHPALHVLPPDEDTRPTTRERIVFLLAAVVPWLALYGFTVSMHLPGTAFRFPFEHKLPIYWWTSILYQTSYITVALAPWSARTKRELRQLTITAWVASAVVFPFYWVVPSLAPRRPFDDDNPVANLLHWERNTYPPTAAFPSFHTLWAIFVARLYRPRWLGTAYIAAIAISCITTGMHYIPDVLASFAIAPFLLHPQRVWRWLVHLVPVRATSRVLPSSLAGLVQIMIVMAVAGAGNEWKVLLTSFAGVLGMAVLSARTGPFYGSAIAVALTCLIFDDRWLLLAAHSLAAPWTEAVARFLKPCSESHCRRVDVATALTTILLGAIIARLWISGSSASIVCGAYAIGTGLIRFVEEAYKGEPQPVTAGLHRTRGMAVAMSGLGAVVTALPAP